MDAIEIEIPGDPVPQPRARVSTRGGFGRAYTPSDHPVHAFRQAIVLKARHARASISGAAELEVEAVFARPKSHWRKHTLADSAPLWPRPDGDNVLKAVADALTDAGVWPDDSQVVSWHITKRFAARGQPGRTIIRVRSANV